EPRGKAKAATSQSDGATSTSDESVKASEGTSATSKSSASAKSEQAAASTGNGRSAAQTAEELRRTKSSPLVRRIAQEHGVDIAGLEGTGLSGRVTKNDILSFIESGSPVAATAATPAATRPTAIPAAPEPAPLKPGAGD